MVPFLQREAEAVASLSPGERKILEQTWKKSEENRNVYDRLRQRFRLQDMTVKDVQRIVGITKRQLTDWDSRWVRAWAQTRQGNGWRRFSITDMINLTIIKTIKAMGMPINRFGREFTDWVQEARIVEGLIVPFSLGRQIYMAIELRKGGLGCFWDDAHPECAQQLNSAVAPIVCLPLKPVFGITLKAIKRGDFEARQVNDGTWGFRVSKDWINFKLWARWFTPK